MGIRDDIRKGKVLGSLLRELEGRLVDRERFNELLISRGLRPLPSSPDAGEEKGGSGDEGPPGDIESSPSSGAAAATRSTFEITRDTEAPAVSNPCEGRASVIFDVEVYPNFFLAVFLGGEGFHVFTLEERAEMIRYLSDGDKLLIGFNNFSYDNIVLQHVFDRDGLTHTEVHGLSKRLIEGSVTKNQKSLLGRPTVDLFAMKFRRTFLSLKELAVRMNHLRVQSLPYSADVALSDQQKSDVVAYCINDIRVTAAVWELVQEDVRLRQQISTHYGIDVISDSEAAICERLFGHLYLQKNRHFVPKRIYRDGEKINFASLVPEWVHFRQDDLHDLLNDFKSVSALSCEIGSHARRQIKFRGKTYQLGLGGIHSEDSPGIFAASDDLRLVDMDVQSYYPSIILKEKLYPDHLTKDWTDVLRELTEKRIDAKQAGDKTTSNTLKILINGANGKTLQESSFMYDPKVYYSVVFTGQFALLMLIEKLAESGIQVFSANTDGLVIAFDADKNPAFEAALNEWTRLTGFILEKSDIARYVRKDVNNYLMVKADGILKRKGIFDAPSIYRKADASIIGKALCDHFVSGTPVEHTIKNEKDILKFAYSFSPKKEGYQLFVGSHIVAPPVRWYVSRNGVALEKRKEGKSIKVPNASRITIINQLASTAVPDDIDFDHYIREAQKIISQIENGRGDHK